tara:strand:+ start:12862 stop:14253 length:1392 start_codon:yes stop_codon:yes gene_type:complete
MKKSHIQHLYWRAGFGLGPDQLSKLKKKSKKNIVSDLFKEAKGHKELSIDLSEFAVLRQKNYKKTRKEYGIEAFKQLQKKSRSKVRDLNLAWLERLKEPESVLREKMTLFWANVFVCKDQNIWNIQKYNNVLRKHALGDLNSFVKAISHEASMIDYLNNRQNIKKSPNENFARELMELFTLGAGNYTEDDIKASARSFTGWNRDRFGNFVFNKKHHDTGQKTFFGKTGNFDGNDIIDIILEQEQCARFICTKVYTYFVNPKVDKKRIEELTALFYKDYDIEKLMLHIFSSDWFYEEKNIGVKIKSPIELLLGIHTTVPHTFLKKKQPLYLQKMMGQILLNPVNVAGWKGNQNWIDSNTLMFRLKLPSILLNNAVIHLDEKGDIEGTFDEYYKKRKKGKNYIKTKIYWDVFDNNYKKTSPQELKEILISSPINPDTKHLIDNLVIDNNRDYCIQLMSIPEYQLC